MLLSPACSPGNASVTSTVQLRLGPAAAFEPALVHPGEHLRPILCLGPTGAGIDAEDAVVAIIGIVQKELQLQLIQVLEEGVGIRLDLLFQCGLRFRRFGLGQFEHDLEILELFSGLGQRLDAIPQAVGLGNGGLRLLAVVPEIVRGHLSSQLIQPLLRLGDVKETSAGEQACLRRRSTGRECLQT